MVYTKVVTNKSPWLAKARAWRRICQSGIPWRRKIRGTERDGLESCLQTARWLHSYCDPEGNVTKDEEWNVNGSYYAIEGITSPDGRVLGKMAHSERRGRSVAVNIYGEQDMKIFESGVAYFK